MTLQQTIDEYLIEQQIRGNSDKTIIYYKRCLRMFQEFLKKQQIESTEEITQGHCKGYYFELKQQGNRTSTTIQTYIRAIRAFLSWCYTEGYIAENIPARFKLPKAQRKTIDVLTEGEIKRLMACFDTRDRIGLRNYCICALMLDSGLRLNEVVTLESGNVHIAEGYIIVNGKGDKQRIVPLGLQSKKSLIRYCASTPKRAEKTPLFEKDTLTPLKQSTVKQLFRKLKIKADIPRLRPHLLRHSFATRYLENGGDIYSLQMILGHTSLEMVKRYVHLTSAKTVVNFARFSPLDNILKQ